MNRAFWEWLHDHDNSDAIERTVARFVLLFSRKPIDGDALLQEGHVYGDDGNGFVTFDRKLSKAECAAIKDAWFKRYAGPR